MPGRPEIHGDRRPDRLPNKQEPDAGAAAGGAPGAVLGAAKPPSPTRARDALSAGGGPKFGHTNAQRRHTISACKHHYLLAEKNIMMYSLTV